MQNFTFTVTAMDNGKPEPFTGSAEVTIMVFSRENDFNPVLDQERYVATVNENEPNGTSVLTFNVFDSDPIGPSSEIGEITLFGTDAQFFAVRKTDSNSGEIVTK